MLWTKRAHQYTICWTFDGSDESSHNCSSHFWNHEFRIYWNFASVFTLICSFRWKYIKFQLMKYRGVICHDTEEWCQFWRKTDLLFQKWQKFGEFWSEPSKLLKICTLIGPFCTKYIIFDPKKYRGVIYHDTQESCKIWRKTDLWFRKWHKEFIKFPPAHLKVSKLLLWWENFVQSRTWVN